MEDAMKPTASALVCTVFACMLCLVACSDPEEEPTPGALEGPCLDESWGPFITSPGNSATVAVVEADASPGGDGSAAAPFASVMDAVEHARYEDGARHILLLAGDYGEQLWLSESLPDDATDSGLWIAGCERDEVRIVAPDPEEPAVDVDAVSDVILEALTVVGGRRSLTVRGGAGSMEPVLLRNLLVQEGRRVAVVIDGDLTAVNLVDVVVDDPVVDPGGLPGLGLGWGMAVQGAVLGVTVDIQGGSIAGATEVGLMASYAHLSIDGLEVEGTRANGDDLFGRGLHLQNVWSGELWNMRLSDNHDAALYARTSFGLNIHDNEVRTVQAAPVEAGQSDITGDGIVVTQGDDQIDPSLLAVTLTGNDVDGTDRALILIDRVNATVNDNITSPGNSITSQGNSIVEGNDPVTDMTANPLALNNDLFEDVSLLPDDP
jgi:hypothetical protein